MDQKRDEDKPPPSSDRPHRKITVAFLYNVRHIYPNPSDVRSHLQADFDDPPVIEKMIDHLKNCGFNVIPIEADEKAYLKLYKNKNKIDIAFNYSEGLFGQCRESHIPAILEMLRIPFTGSSSITQGIGFNKLHTKEILIANKIATAPYQLFKNSKEKLNKNLHFPLIVKPVAEGSSAGITNKSIVKNERELKKQIDFIVETFKQPALVEKFLPGREFSVPMLGNPPKVLSIIEADHSKKPKKFQPIDSLEMKWIEEEKEGNDHLGPAKITKNLENQITDLCEKTCLAIGTLDWCRVDVRLDEKGKPFVLEVNSPAGMLPPEVYKASYFPLAAKFSGLNYQNLLKKIITISLKRHELIP